MSLRTSSNILILERKIGKHFKGWPFFITHPAYGYPGRAKMLIKPQPWAEIVQKKCPPSFSSLSKNKTTPQQSRKPEGVGIQEIGGQIFIGRLFT